MEILSGSLGENEEEEEKNISSRGGERIDEDVEERKVKELSTREVLEVARKRVLLENHCEGARKTVKDGEVDIEEQTEETLGEVLIDFDDFKSWVQENYGEKLFGDLTDEDEENLEKMIEERNRYEMLDYMSFTIHEIGDHGYDHLLDDAIDVLGMKMLNALKAYIEDENNLEKERAELKMNELGSPQGMVYEPDENEDVGMYLM